MAGFRRRIPPLAHAALITRTLRLKPPLPAVTDPGVAARLLARVTSTLDAAQGSWDSPWYTPLASPGAPGAPFAPGASPQGHHSPNNNEARLDHSPMGLPSARPHHWPLPASPSWSLQDGGVPCSPPAWRGAGATRGASGFVSLEGPGLLRFASSGQGSGLGTGFLPGQAPGSREFASGQGSRAASRNEPCPEGPEAHREISPHSQQSADSMQTGAGQRTRQSSNSMGGAANLQQQSAGSIQRSARERTEQSSSMGGAATLQQQSEGPQHRGGWTEEDSSRKQLEEGETLLPSPPEGATGPSERAASPGQGDPGDGKVVLYRGRGMRILRILVRLKVAQLAAVGATAIPIAVWTQGGHVSVLDMAAIAAVVGGAAAASAALWYYSSRYIGELALVPPRSVVISTLDFWGNREDKTFDLRDVVPPLQGLSGGELAQVAKHVFVPLDVVGNHQYVLSLRHGRILDRARLHSLLTDVASNQDGHNK